jgi:hypothetical protein
MVRKSKYKTVFAKGYTPFVEAIFYESELLKITKKNDCKSENIINKIENK